MKLVAVFTVIFFMISCNNIEIKHAKYTKACVDSTRHILWWSSYYKLEVFYHYKVKDSIYSSSYIDKNSKEYAYTASYNFKDSVLIAYSKESPERSKIIKKTYIHEKDYQIP